MGDDMWGEEFDRELERLGRLMAEKRAAREVEARAAQRRGEAMVVMLPGSGRREETWTLDLMLGM